MPWVQRGVIQSQISLDLPPCLLLGPSKPQRKIVICYVLLCQCQCFVYILCHGKIFSHKETACFFSLFFPPFFFFFCFCLVNSLITVPGHVLFSPSCSCIRDVPYVQCIDITAPYPIFLHPDHPYPYLGYYLVSCLWLFDLELCIPWQGRWW